MKAEEEQEQHKTDTSYVNKTILLRVRRINIFLSISLIIRNSMYNVTCELLGQIYWKSGRLRRKMSFDQNNYFVRTYDKVSFVNKAQYVAYLSIKSNANYRLQESVLEFY
jgi:hypothetical protein